MSKLNALFAFFITALLCVSCSSKKDTVEISNTEEKNLIDYKGTYRLLWEDKKYDEVFAHLQAWEAKEPNNPEMYIAFFNYYINTGRSSMLSLYREGEDNYIGESTQYNNDSISKAIKYIDKGLSIAPNRLDMHFGKIYLLNEMKYYKEAKDELYATLEISKKIDNNWLWTDNEKAENAKVSFLRDINDYYSKWFKIGTEETLGYLKQLAEKQIELYPESIFAYNLMAAYHNAKKQPEESLKYLFQAEKIDPSDCVVLANIGETYLILLDNKQKAKEYFKKILEIGDEEDKEYAEYFLKELQ
jgi:tetratricopeptide (TPR) repeat protein